MAIYRALCAVTLLEAAARFDAAGRLVAPARLRDVAPGDTFEAEQSVGDELVAALAAAPAPAAEAAEARTTDAAAVTPPTSASTPSATPEGDAAQKPANDGVRRKPAADAAKQPPAP